MHSIMEAATRRRLDHRLEQARWSLSPADALIYGLTFGPACLFLAAVWFQPWFSISDLMRDPLVVASMAEKCCSPHYGFVSNLGVMLWTATSAVCLFAALLLFGINGGGGNVVFLAAGGIFTGWLALDDFFLLHEDVLPFFGVPEIVTYTAYTGVAALYFALSWRKILLHRPVMMGLALVLLGTSVFIDVFIHSERDIRLFLEDGAKFLGIVAWTSFHVTAALSLCATSIAQPRPLFISRALR